MMKKKRKKVGVMTVSIGAEVLSLQDILASSQNRLQLFWFVQKNAFSEYLSDEDYVQIALCTVVFFMEVNSNSL